MKVLDSIYDLVIQDTDFLAKLHSYKYSTKEGLILLRKYIHKRRNQVSKLKDKLEVEKELEDTR